MRLKTSLFAAAALCAGTSAFLLQTGSASARPCPEGTRYQVVVTVGGVPVGTCVPYTYCDPGPCSPPPTEVAPRD